MRRPVLVVVELLLAAVAAAGPNRWASIGPYGGEIVTGLAIDPVTPSTLYAATFHKGVLKSVDRGASWYSVRSGPAPQFVNRVTIDPAATGTVYAVGDGGVYRTLDGGSSWLSINTGLPASPRTRVVVAGGSPSKIYVTVFYAGVFRSEDGGLSWSARNTGLPGEGAALGTWPLAVDPSSPDTLYVGTAQGVYKTTNGGESWALASGDLSNLEIGSLAVAPSQPSTLYACAVSPSRGLFRSTDAGKSWVKSDAAPDVGFGSLVFVDPRDSATVYVSNGSLFQTTDGGSAWHPFGPNVSIEDLAFDPSSSSSLYVATFLDGVFRSGDRGATWSAANVGITQLDVWALVFDGSALRNLFAATDRGGFRSRDGGNGWTGFGGIAVLAVSPELATAYGVGSSGIFKTTDGGLTWIPTGGAPANPFVNVLVVDPISPRTLYGGTGASPPCPAPCFPPLPAPGVYKSTDGGATWMPAGLQSVFVRALVIDPTAPSLIYAGTGSGVFRSTDGASSWLDASAGLSGAAVYALALDPNAPRTLYAGTSAGVFKSNDFGAFWTPMNAGLTASRVSALALDPIATGTVYAGTDAGVFRSTDAGSSWQALNDGLTDLQVWSLAVDPGSSTVYAGTATSGVFRLASGGSSVCGGGALCLLDGRFEVRASFRADSSALNTLAGPLVLTSSTGAFWFFDSDNIELVVKVLDGRSVNGKFWVFYGALSNVEYTITVTDTLTGAVKTYFNPQGQLASVADTAEF